MGRFDEFLADYGVSPQRPEIMPEFYWMYCAFYRLAPSRNFNGRIPFSEIAIYADRFDVKDFEFFLAVMQHLDAIKGPEVENADTGTEH